MSLTSTDVDYFTMKRILFAFLSDCNVDHSSFVTTNDTSSTHHAIFVYCNSSKVKRFPRHRRYSRAIRLLHSYWLATLKNNHFPRPDGTTLCSIFNHLVFLEKTTVVPMGFTYVFEEDLYYCHMCVVPSTSESITETGDMYAFLFTCVKISTDEEVTELFTTLLKNSFYCTCSATFDPKDPSDTTLAWIYGVFTSVDALIGIAISLTIDKSTDIIDDENINTYIPEDFRSYELLKLATLRAMRTSFKLHLWDARIRVIKVMPLIRCISRLILPRIAYVFTPHTAKIFNKKYRKYFLTPRIKMEF